MPVGSKDNVLQDLREIMKADVEAEDNLKMPELLVLILAYMIRIETKFEALEEQIEELKKQSIKEQ